MADVTVQELNDRFVFGNLDGTWTVWKRHTQRVGSRASRSPVAAAVFEESVGPGYIGRAILRDGTRLCDGFYPTATSANDPRLQGVGPIGFHWYRDMPEEPDIWRKGWDIDGHKPGPFGVTGSRVAVEPHVEDGKAYGSFVVDFGDGWQPVVMRARYDYVVHPSQVQMWVTVYTHAVVGATRPFIKEPKIVVGLNPPTEDGSRFDFAQVYRADGSLLKGFPLEIGDPTKKTRQIGFDTRARVSFFDAGRNLNIVARAAANSDPIGYRTNWEGSALGLDSWAQLSNDRKRLADTPCKPYCLQGPRRLVQEPAIYENTLTRQWEIAKRPGEPGVELMLHAWEGGSGLPDCLCGARLYLGGEKYTSYFSISNGPGWTL